MWIGGVRVIILDDENRVLMVKQYHENREFWLVPGGAIEAGETSIIAAEREVREETGLEVMIGRLIWHVEEVSEDRGMRFVNFFLGDIIGGELKLGEDPEFSEDDQVLREVAFLTKEEIQGLPKVYPEALRDELWDILKRDQGSHQVYKIK
jgi:ADP-ribose pyrophosphatase YjhB (NUDIX family)